MCVCWGVRDKDRVVWTRDGGPPDVDILGVSVSWMVYTVIRTCVAFSGDTSVKGSHPIRPSGDNVWSTTTDGLFRLVLAVVKTDEWLQHLRNNPMYKDVKYKLFRGDSTTLEETGSWLSVDGGPLKFGSSYEFLDSVLWNPNGNTSKFAVTTTTKSSHRKRRNDHNNIRSDDVCDDHNKKFVTQVTTVKSSQWKRPQTKSTVTVTSKTFTT